MVDTDIAPIDGALQVCIFVFKCSRVILGVVSDFGDFYNNLLLLCLGFRDCAYGELSTCNLEVRGLGLLKLSIFGVCWAVARWGLGT